jgi:ParB family chromosome partitioning protein
MKMSSENRQLRNISINLIDPNPNQSRKNYEPESLSELADSIAKVGLINPITVVECGARYILQTGSRRLEAAKLLRQNFIAAFVTRADVSADVGAMLHENLYRSDLSPYEEGCSYSSLIKDGGYDLKKLCHLTGKPESYVSARIKLISMSEEIQSFVHEGKLQISHALELSKIDDTAQQLSYAKYAVETSANLQTVKYWVQQYYAAKNAPAAPDGTPTVSLQPLQMPSFGWNCFVCENHTEATVCKTLHICPECFESLYAQIQKAKS